MQEVPAVQSEWFWAMLSFFWLFVSSFFVGWQIHLQRASHVIQVMRDLKVEWVSERMLMARLWTGNRYMNGKNLLHGEAALIKNFFDEVGVYGRNRLIPYSAIWTEFQYWASTYHLIFEEQNQEYRDLQGADYYYRNFDHLATRLAKISRRKAGDIDSRPTSRVRVDFFEGEVELARALLRDRAECINLVKDFEEALTRYKGCVGETAQESMEEECRCRLTGGLPSLKATAFHKSLR